MDELYFGKIPDQIRNWIITHYKYKMISLCFTAVDAGATVKFKKIGNPDPIKIVTSTDGEHWDEYTLDDNVTEEGFITLKNIDDKVYFRAADDAVNDISFFVDKNNYYRFVTHADTRDKKIASSGNILTLITADGDMLDISKKKNRF